MAEEKQNTSGENDHGASPKIKQKDNIYQAEYFGSGTFRIVEAEAQRPQAPSVRAERHHSRRAEVTSARLIALNRQRDLAERPRTIGIQALHFRQAGGEQLRRDNIRNRRIEILGQRALPARDRPEWSAALRKPFCVAGVSDCSGR